MEIQPEVKMGDEIQEAKTYKQKIRERYKNKKRQASISISPPKVLTQNQNKIDLDYLKEENEVQNILKLRNNGSFESSSQLDKEIAFFTDIYIDPNIPESNNNELNESDKSNSSLKSLSNIQESQTHLASSYLKSEDLSATIKFVKQSVVLDESLLYYPAGNVEPDLFGLLETHRRSLEEEGFYVPEKPKISETNMNQMKNRLVEENNLEYFDCNGEIMGIQKLLADEHPIKSECDKNFPKVFIPAIPMNAIADNYLTQERILNICIQKIVFDQHNIFTEEDSIAKKLENLIEQYKKRQTMDLIKHLQIKLDNLREQKTNLVGCESEYDINLSLQIQTVREKLWKEERCERQLTKNILKTWKSLKVVREETNATYTDLLLVIKRVDTDPESDNEEAEMRYAIELDELINEAIIKYNGQKLAYKSYLRSLEDEKNVNVVTMRKPAKPHLEAIRTELNAIHDEFIRPVGEPLIYFDLVRLESNTMTPRKLGIAGDVKYSVKFTIDNDIVCVSNKYELDHNFVIDFDYAFQVKLTTKIPKTICVVLYEHNKLKVSSKIVQIYVPIPTNNEAFDEIDFTHLEFSAPKLANYSGKLSMKIGWSQIYGEQFTIGVTRKPKIELSRELLQKWYDEYKLNPMDPESMDLMLRLNMLQTPVAPATEPGPSDPDMFRLNEDSMTFCTEEELNSNERLKLLKARFDNDLRFKNLKFIPHQEREIQVQHNTVRIIDETIGMEPIDLQRHNGKKYLRKVYEAITNHCDIINMDMRNTNLLSGDQVPTFGSLSLAFFEIFGSRRPLKPTRRSPSSRSSCRLNEVNHFNIFVTVVRAFGIPLRNDDQMSATTRRNSNMSSTRQSFKTINVRPYISVSIKDKTVRTSTVEGSNPTWNEQLSIGLDLNSDQIKKTLNIDLFDEYVEDLLEDERSRATEVYQRISSKWLGELKIPISTIYNNQRIEGTFEITTPPFILGYSRKNQTSQEYSSIFVENLPDLRELTHISLFISLEPIVDIPKLITTGLECIELKNTKTHINLWLEQYRIEFPARAVDPLITLLNGKRACITRLIGAVTLPFDKNEYTDFLIRRYVSLIPVYQNIDACTGITGVWLTNEQVINMMCATVKDLAVLLICFYTALEYKVWLLVGHSISCGDTCYVLLTDGTEYFIIDPETGKKYSTKDTYCPTDKVYYLINKDNIWGNIQKEKRVFLTQFEVSHSSEWRPLFNKSHEAPADCLHNENMIFKRSLSVSDLQKTIERKLIKKMSTWRSHRKTVWNRYVSESLKKILVELEKDACFEYNSERFLETLNHLNTTSKVHGFPINMRYSSLSGIVSHIKSTGIHLNSNNKVEFSLGVYVAAYPNNVLSVWIFLVSLVPKI